MNLTDTHCHLDLMKFDMDREAVVERAIRAGVGRILIPGLNLVSSQSVVKLVESNPILFAAIGIHPTEVTDMDPTALKTLRRESQYHKVKAVGEIGLDYYWDTTPRQLQRDMLKEQLAMSAEIQLPVVIHFRNAEDAPRGNCTSDLMKILDEWVTTLRRDKSPLAEKPGVLHSFSGDLDTAKEAMSLGFSLGISGSITYEKGDLRRDLVSALPLEYILMETDAPFQTPLPHRGKRNEPAYVSLIADKIALVKSCTSELVANETSRNAKRLFAWE